MQQPKYQPVDLRAVKTYPIEERPTRVSHGDLAQPLPANASLTAFLASLPHILKADELRGVVAAIVRAHALGKPVIVGMGGHVVKCGLTPLLITLMEEGIISAIAMNGGASIHDFEMALLGRTSEDVAATLEDGRFGMVRETGIAMNDAIARAAREELGMGRALGEQLHILDAPFRDLSLLAAGARLGIPVTVHSAIGGDCIHMHPGADGAALGAAFFTDYRLLIAVVQELGDGGVYLNLGSAVILPEVFMKALNVARNLAQAPIINFTTADLDMQFHYRPRVNVVQRPTLSGGKGYSLTGHHEIMIPLVFSLVRAAIATAEEVTA